MEQFERIIQRSEKKIADERNQPSRNTDGEDDKKIDKKIG